LLVKVFSLRVLALAAKINFKKRIFKKNIWGINKKRGVIILHPAYGEQREESGEVESYG